MSSVLLGLIAGLIGLGLAALFQWSYQRERHARLGGLELKPNCLLTRYPIVFLAGRPSLFRLFDHWNEVPSFLREHGYEVLVIEPAPKRSSQSIADVLKALPKKFHVIADSSVRSELTALAQEKTEQIVSLTLIQNARAAQASTLPSVADLKPMALPIEIVRLKIAASEVSRSWKSYVIRVLTAAHNRFFAGLGHQVDPLETATLPTRAPWAIELRYLDLAVRLAERDAGWNGHGSVDA